MEFDKIIPHEGITKVAKLATERLDKLQVIKDSLESTIKDLYLLQSYDDSGLVGGMYIEKSIDNLILAAGMLKLEYKLYKIEDLPSNIKMLSYNLELSKMIEVLRELLYDIEKVYEAYEDTFNIGSYIIVKLKESLIWLLQEVERIRVKAS